MVKWGGYMGKTLMVNLTDGIWEDRVFSEEILRQYIGGSGLAAKILWDETDKDTDPLGSENVLIFMTGPTCGTNVPMSGRHAVVAKSPATGIWGESDCGGSFGVALKKAGYDGIVFIGKSSKPVYLYIDCGKVEIRDASHLWGKNTYKTYELIKAETSTDAEVSCIGPAGEKMVKMAGIFSDGKDARASGRGGLGAVMGSKNLKAIAARGTFKPEVRHLEDFKKMRKRLASLLSVNMKSMRDFGTTNSYLATEECGDMPIKNWQKGSFKSAKNTTGQVMAEKYLIKNYYCKGCVVGCGRVIKIDSGKYTGVDGAGPEYESMASLGANCLIDDLAGICKANELCNQYGIDTISVGAVIALGMELYEKGIITKKDTNGIELVWGDVNAEIAMIHQIGKKEGLGAIMGEGVKAIANHFRDVPDECVIHVKGLEPPMHDPRAFFSLAVGYATSNRGACHLSAYSDSLEKGVTMPEWGYNEPFRGTSVEGKGIMTAKMGNLCSLYDAVKSCKFLFWGGAKATDLLEMMNTVTGFNMELDEFMCAGERIFNLKRMYNVRIGLSRKDDILPIRILTSPRGSGGAPDTLPPLGIMLDEYYKYRGWSEEGIPTKETLKKLNLEFIQI